MTRDESANVLIGRVLAREGGVADVGDGQGVTRFGQTPNWLLHYGLTAPKDQGEAAANYRIWLVRTGLIGACDYADDFADSLIDFAVNSGHRVAITNLQRVLRIQADGIWGPETQAAVDIIDRPAVARRMLGSRLRFLGQIISRNPNQHAQFASGWMSRIAGQVEALA